MHERPDLHERIIGLYEENADAWDRQRGRDLFEAPQLERFAAFLSPGASILDIGCGMAEPIGRWLIERGFAVTGIDSSPSLIAICRTRFPEHEWIVGDMRSLALRRRFDSILAWHSLFHLAPGDQEAMFPIFAAHAAPGAILMFTSGDERGESIGRWQGEPLYHGSLDPEEYRALLGGNGFPVLDYRPRDPELGDATVWLARAE
jgi:2-polyprenyl-3-methyl-5-hydroxy-6-metoxy-1,4-benzoquinol methylase